jgi:hypothetical protein
LPKPKDSVLPRHVAQKVSESLRIFWRVPLEQTGSGIFNHLHPIPGENIAATFTVTAV